MHPAERTRRVVERARALGFDLCGVAPAEGLDELGRLPEWLERGYAGEMSYLRDPRRLAPDRVLAGARSIIVCALNYNTPLPYSTEAPLAPSLVPRTSGSAPVGRGFSPDKSTAPKERALAPEGEDFPRAWISRYAWGEDYHDVLGEKLEALVAALRADFAEPFEARAYVDTGPVVERVAAKHAGLGWLAKNTCLINEQLGSWLFLGVILTTLELAPSLGPAEVPPPDLCGNCRLCIDACPTAAIVEPYLLDARRCISYLTIELRGPVPENLRAPMGRMVFGCDICQDVCPWNRQAPVTPQPRFRPRVIGELVGALLAAPNNENRNSKIENRPGVESTPVGARHGVPEALLAPSLESLVSLTQEQFREIFRGNAIKRAKWRGLVRNACIALGNSGVSPGSAAHERITALLRRLMHSGDAVISEHARWALERLKK